MTKREDEMTTAMGVGSGLEAPLGRQPKPPIDRMAYDFYATYGTTNPSNAMTAFADYTRAQRLSPKEARELKRKITDDYGVYVIADMPIPAEPAVNEAVTAARPLDTMATRTSLIKGIGGGDRRTASTDRRPLARKLRVEGAPAGPDDKDSAQAKNPAGEPVRMAPETPPKDSAHAHVTDAVAEAEDHPWWTVRHKKTGAVLAFRRAPNPHRAIQLAIDDHNVGAHPSRRMKPGHYEATPGRANQVPSAQKRRIPANEGLTVADDGIGDGRFSGGAPMDAAAPQAARRGQEEPEYRKTERKRPVAQAGAGKPGSGGTHNTGVSGGVRIPGGPIDTNEAETRTGQLSVPDEPVSTEETHMFCIRQLGAGLFEISFDGAKTRHALRMAEEAIRFRLLGFGGPYLRHAPEIARWLATEAKVGDEYAIDTQRGRAFILDDDGFKKHVRSELFV